MFEYGFVDEIKRETKDTIYSLSYFKIPCCLSFFHLILNLLLLILLLLFHFLLLLLLVLLLLQIQYQRRRRAL